MKNFNRKLIGITALLFTMSFTVNAQNCASAIQSTADAYQEIINQVQATSDGYWTDLQICNSASYANGIYLNNCNSDKAEIQSELNAANQQIISLQSQLNNSLTQADLDAAYAAGAASVTPEDGISQADVTNATPLSLNIPLSLPEGWSLFGYSCIDPIDVIDGFSDVVSDIEIVKDEMGLSYLPLWSYNAIGDLKYGEGYQIKLTNHVSSFQFCPTLTVKVIGCTDETAFNYNENANSDDESCQPIVNGCTQLNYVEYNSNANTDNGSCFTVVTNDCIVGQNGAACVELAIENGVDFNSIEDFEVYICLANGDCQSAFENYIGELAEVLGLPYTCEDANACNYMENTSCSYPEMNCYDCNNILINSEDLEGSDACNSLVLEQGGILVNSTDTISWNFTDPNSGATIAETANDIPDFVVAVYDLENELDNNAFTWFEAMAAIESLVIDGYDDWVLPTPAQLAVMSSKVGPENGNIANLISNNFYWSTDYSEERAHYSVFYESQAFYSATSPKNGYSLVRVVRNLD